MKRKTPKYKPTEEEKDFFQRIACRFKESRNRVRMPPDKSQENTRTGAASVCVEVIGTRTGMANKQELKMISKSKRSKRSKSERSAGCAPAERRHLRLEAVVVEAMGVAVCRVVEQTHLSPVFHAHGDCMFSGPEVEGKIAYLAGLPVLEEGRIARCLTKTTLELHLGGTGQGKGKPILVELAFLPALKAVVREYNETNGGEAAPVGRGAPASGETLISIE